MIDLLHYTFFQNALLGACLASIVCGIIGTYIVARVWCSSVVASPTHRLVVSV